MSNASRDTSTVPADEWKAIQPNSTIELKLNSGVATRGKFLGFRADSLSLGESLILEAEGQEINVAPQNIEYLRAIEKKNSVVGAFATGLAIDLVVLYLLTRSFEDNDYDISF